MQNNESYSNGCMLVISGEIICIEWMFLHIYIFIYIYVYMI